MSQLATFHVGRYLFGIDVCLVREIVRLPVFTPVPMAPAEIAGLINLRGSYTLPDCLLLALNTKKVLAIVDESRAA